MHRAAPPLLLTVVLTSCVAPPQGVPPPRPVAPVTMAPPPAALTPPPVALGTVEAGDWSYTRTGSGSNARFGSAGSVALSLECTASGAVMLRVLRLDPAAPATAAMLRASATAKSVAVAGGSAFGTAQIAPRDPILDALAFSRGRFGVSIDGRERWYPAWPEVTRVVEDCRS